MMKTVIVLAALCACAMGSISWPRLPLQLILTGKFDNLKFDNDRIVGGAPVEEGSVPFQVRLERKTGTGGSLSCGGSILSSTVILNAAHCVQSFVPASNRIVAGEHNVTVVSGHEQIRDITRAVFHPLYNANTFLNDIAVIYLAEALEFNEWVRPVNLPEPSLDNTDVAENTIVTISGWGTTSAGGAISLILRSVDAPVVSDQRCGEAYNPRYEIFPSMICAGKIGEGGVDSCQGDSGGPLFTGKGAEAIQWGIVSWGIGCADPRYPGVYTEVTYFRDWIEKQLVETL